ncbi:MFS transporter [Georgenia halophila]|uniref:MFS transporter n=1 Tax=Georgenia halophila TaxID=620889 RepID=A0ABP8L5P0_9MICO
MSHEPLLAHRDFRLLLLGQTTAQLGTQVSAVAIPLLAVVTLHASSLEVGIINAASTVAFALIGLQAGAWLDRVPRRGVLIVSDVLRAVLLATIPVAWWLDMLTIAQLVIVSFLVGFARVFFDVGYQSYIPSVIGKDRVLAGNSAMEFLRASGQVAGPGLGGALVSVFGAALVVLVQAVTFAVSAVTLLAIRTRESSDPAPGPRPRMRSRIAEGLRFVLRNRVLRATAIVSATGNFSFAMASAVTMIFMARELGLSATVIGLVIAGGSLAVMLGSALTPRLAKAIGSARVIWVALALTAPLTLLTPLARPGWGVILVVLGMAAGELGQIVYAITNISLRQRLTPDRLLGRVNATMRFLIMGLFPLGAIIGGTLGQLIGARATLVVVGVLVVLSPIPLWLALRGMRDVEELPAWDS